MKRTKKILSIVLSIAMVMLMAIPSYAVTTPSGVEYDAAKVAAGDVADLSIEQIAGIILDYVDALLAKVDVDVNYQDFEINTADMLDLDSLAAWGYQAISQDLLGGDFDNLDASALSGISRADGDIAFIGSWLQFMADNADYFGKVFSWTEGDTFDCGLIGEYLESLDEADDARVFYENYILGNNIQSAFVGEIAREMGYTIPEGETFDQTINNGILAWVAETLQNAGLLSDAGVAALKAYDLKTEDIYYHLKNLVSLLQEDNKVKEDTYLTYYLDSVIRTVLKATFGYTPVEGDAVNDEALVAEFKNAYQDLDLLKTISNGKVYYKAKDGSYYAVTVATDGITFKALTWQNTLGLDLDELPVLDIYTGDNDKLVKEYTPMSEKEEDYQPKIYTQYAVEGIETVGTTLPDEYQAIVNANDPIEMKDYVKVVVTQGDKVTNSQTISFDDIKAYAEQTALEMAQSTVASSGMSAYVSVDAVNITLTYTGYATDDEFIVNVTAEAQAVLSGTFASYAQSTVDSAVASAISNPIASVVIDNLSGDNSDLKDVIDFMNFIDTDFDVDLGIIDFAGNYDNYGGVIGQVNRVFCDLIKMLLTDEGYESLNLTEGGNQNLTANLDKLREKAGKMMEAAKKVMDENKFEEFTKSTDVSSLFASSHGFNASMIYNLDFSSNENLYVCAIRIGLDFIAEDNKDSVLYDIHMLVENLDSLDAMAVAVTDYALAKALGSVELDGFEYTYTQYTQAEVDALNDTLKTTTAKDIIMSKLVDVAYYTVNDWGFPLVNKLLNSAIDKFNSAAESSIIPEVNFVFGVQKGSDWNETLTAMVDRVLDLTNGIIGVVSTIPSDANVFDKISYVANAILPLGSMFSNCAGNGFVCDLNTMLNTYLFGEALDGNFDNFLRLFETSVKTDDCAKGVPVTFALIKASEHIVDSVFPDTVQYELYASYTPAAEVQEYFTSSKDDAVIAANNMRSINAQKETLVPAVLKLAREAGILPSLVFADCNHETTITVAAIPATCISTGYTEGTRCTNCGQWISGHEVIAKDAEAHVGPIENVEAVAATCTTGGTAAGTKCSACGVVVSGCEATAALGHDYKASKTVAATCTEGGYTVYTCSRCDSSYNDDATAALGHDYKASKTVAATCTEAGYTVYTCLRCDSSYNGNTTAALGHSYGEWKVVTPASCDTAGSEARTCTNGCGTTETGEITATGHTDSDGDELCDNCGTSLAKEKTFFEKIADFFRSIIEWFKNLFK